jgi:hypothetical protein
MALRPCRLPVALALTGGLVSGLGQAAPTRGPVRHARLVDRSAPRPPPPSAFADGQAPWAVALAAVEVKNRTTNARGKLRLYSDDGGIDRSALQRFMRIACSSADDAVRLAPGDDQGAGERGCEVVEPLDPRLVQLAFRAAYHFGGRAIVVISATRKGAHGKHGTGDALDFQLEGVRAAALAAYVRSFPRAGVGTYTHPRTQFVHLDVRDRSFHWTDGSPPGVTWRKKLLSDPTQQKRDASYVAAMDLPEAATR